MFEVFLKELNELGGGVRAFDKCAREARARIASEPDNASALFLIAFAAQRFVEAYDDQPLTVDAATAERDAFQDVVKTLDKAFAGGSVDDKLSALNIVAHKLTEASKD